MKLSQHGRGCINCGNKTTEGRSYKCNERRSSPNYTGNFGAKFTGRLSDIDKPRGNGQTGYLIGCSCEYWKPEGKEKVVFT